MNDKHLPDTETMSIDDVSERLPVLIDEIMTSHKRIAIEMEGEPVAVIISTTDLQALSQSNDLTDRRWQLLEMMREPFRGIPAEEIERETTKAVAEVRAEMKTERLAAASLNPLLARRHAPES